MSCAALSCPSRTTERGVKNSELSFHRFPKCPQIRKQWIKATGRGNWEPNKNSRFCSKHFKKSCFIKGLSRRQLKTDAVPTIFKRYTKSYQPVARKRKALADPNLSLRNQKTIFISPRKRRRLEESGIEAKDIPPTTTEDAEQGEEEWLDDELFDDEGGVVKDEDAGPNTDFWWSSDYSSFTRVQKLFQEKLPLVNICRSTVPTRKLVNSCNMHYLSQKDAAALDQELFNEYKFSVDQLMELAGLSVAAAVAKTFPPSSHNSVLIICGPGNNGGDGLVAARHMTLFGYKVSIHYPKRTPKPLYENLLHQCVQFGVNILDKLPPPKDLQKEYKVLVDALFGFSFKPPVRMELKPALDALIEGGLPVCSVDIPSGWDVENGPGSDKALKPALLISLSAPKQCAKPEFIGSAKHYLGGRFLPPGIISKYNLTLPAYQNQDQIVEIC